MTGIGKYYASEVSLDYGSKDVCRIDFLQFEPANTMTVSGIEKGIFTCYEIKSCKEDFNSGYGLNFIGEKNYLVMTMETYKAILPELPRKGCGSIGVMVAVPQDRKAEDEFLFAFKISVHSCYSFSHYVLLSWLNEMVLICCGKSKHIVHKILQL